MRNTTPENAMIREEPMLLRAMGLIGIAGCIALVAGTIVAPFFVPDYNWISDTISDLSAGQSEIIMDVALYLFAAGVLATALGAAHAHLGAGFWSAGVVALALAGALVIMIGARNEYGDGDTEGIVVHIYFVYGLGLMFALIPFSMAHGLAAGYAWARSMLYGLGTLWVLSAPPFFFMPTEYDGLYERALGLLSCGMILVLCTVFLQRGAAASARQSGDTADT